MSGDGKRSVATQGPSYRARPRLYPPLNRAGLEQVKAVEPHTRFGCFTLETQRNGYWLADLARERPSASLDEARHRVVLRHGTNKVWLELVTKQVERGPILD